MEVTGITVDIFNDVFYKDPGLDLLNLTSNLVGTNIIPPINPITVNNISVSPIVSVTPAVISTKSTS